VTKLAIESIIIADGKQAVPQQNSGKLSDQSKKFCWQS
jgi:hypothetical protein